MMGTIGRDKKKETIIDRIKLGFHSTDYPADLIIHFSSILKEFHAIHLVEPSV